MPLFGAAYAAPNKGTTILYWFRSPKTLLDPPVNGKIQGLFKALSVLQVLVKANFIFIDFQESPVYSSTFQACGNPVKGGFCDFAISTKIQHAGLYTNI